MRLLIDECIDERLRHFFPEYDCQTATLRWQVSRMVAF